MLLSPILKAALIGEDIFLGNESLAALRSIKTKNELIGEVIGLLQSPISRVISALQNGKSETADATPEVAAEAPVAEATTEAPVAETETPVEEAPAAESETPAAE